MLRKGIIPDKQPTIHVGIILPEDNIHKLILEIPKNKKYSIKTDHGTENIDQFSLELKLENKTIQVGLNAHAKFTQEVFIESEKKSVPSHKSGVKICCVVAGRGFHWQKQIEVFLPDILWFRIIDGKLVLSNILPLEHYVMCVATSEMAAECPDSLIESQTITARFMVWRWLM